MFGGARHAGARDAHRGAKPHPAVRQELVHRRRLQDALAEVWPLPVRQGRPVQVEKGREGHGQIPGESGCDDISILANCLI